jgi:hypothetical protein
MLHSVRQGRQGLGDRRHRCRHAHTVMLCKSRTHRDGAPVSYVREINSLDHSRAPYKCVGGER